MRLAEAPSKPLDAISGAPLRTACISSQVALAILGTALASLIEGARRKSRGDGLFEQGSRPTTTASAKARLLPLDLARGIAALLVALYHLQDYGWIKFPSGAPTLAVPFFFILSGFVLSYSYGDLIRSGRMHFGDFVRARLARLYPLHFVTMIVVILLWLIFRAYPEYFSPNSVHPLPDTLFSPLQLFESVTLLFALAGGGNGLNSPSWSISIEFWCAMLIFVYCSRGTLRWGLVVTIAIAIALLVSWQGRLVAVGWPPRAYLTGAGCFAVGWLLHALLPWSRTLTMRVPSGLWWLVAAVALAGIIGPAWDYSRWQPVYYVVFAVLIAILAPIEVSSRVGRQLMARAGDWSYGIYLWHFPLIALLVWLDGVAKARLGLGFLGSAAADLGFLGLLVVLSAWSYRHLELPAKDLLRARPVRAQGAS